MYHYVLAMILVTAYSSEGIPLSPTNGTLADSLQKLTNRCQNAVLANLINSKLNSCRVSASLPPYNEQQLQCLIFYDVNSQLCDAVTPELTIRDDVTAAIDQPLDVEELCKQLIGTQIVDLPEYPAFKPIVEKVFKTMISCARFCGVPEVTSEDSNFFCKHFKWGIGVLDAMHKAKSNIPSADRRNPLLKSPLLHKASVPQKPVALADKNQIVPETPVSMSPVLNPLPPKTSDGVVVHDSKTENSKLVATANENPMNDIEVEKPIESVSGEGNSKPEIPKPVDKKEDLGKATSSNILTDEDKKKPSPLNTIENPSNVGVDNVLPNDLPTLKPEIKEQETEAVQEVPANSGAAKSKPKKGGVQKKPEVDTDLNDDYQDAEDGRDGPDMVLAGDNGEDPLLTDADDKLEQSPQAALNTHKNSLPSLYAEDKVTYTTKYQDVYADDDDHFFPMFLSVIVLVVLLYVLYHNKNKVTKVVLGLIVEGRQSGGRRRGSRGHAYRRLDTLEQAMSAPSSAAPNKIIY